MTNTKLHVEVNDVQATATLTGALTSGMVGIPVTFQFDECWDELKKLAVFSDGKQKVFLDLDLVDDVTIPHEVLKEAGALVRVGVEGRKTDGTVVIPTRWADVGVVLFGAQAGNEPALNPTPSVYDQIMQRLDELEATQDPDAIKNAVDEYLRENPVEVPVESVNGKTGDVQLTAEDVGAISRDELQAVTNDVLAQAKESGEFDGEKGDKGDKGDPGEPGSPGKDGADGKDGAPGKDGVDGKDGADGQPGAPGKDGKDGQDGYTPVKGIDYYTEADKEEMVDMVMAALPEYDGTVIVGGGASFISFTIDGTSYQAEDGMTWEEWLESDYNTPGYTHLLLNGVETVLISGNGLPGYGLSYDDTFVPITDTIVADRAYVQKTGTHGGGSD